MKFNNPWIDPRVEKVRAADAEAYLLQRGWTRVPFPREEVHLFAGPTANGGEPITQPVPMNEQAGDYLQGVISLITNLAILEERTASAVLEDMLTRSEDGQSEGSANKNSRSKRRTAG